MQLKNTFLIYSEMFPRIHSLNSLFKRIRLNVSNYSSTVDYNELQHFSKFTSYWWDIKGPMRLLQFMNKVRIPFIKQSIEYAMENSKIDSSPKSFQDIKLLEVGCGGGILAESLSKLKLQVTGIDMAEELIEVAKEHASKNENLKNLSYFCTTVEEFCNKHKNEFDVLVASELVEHVPNVEEFLTEALKAVKPGGSLVITTINKTFLARIYAILFLEGIKTIPPGTHSYEKLVPPSLLKTILEKNSFRIIKIQGVSYNFIKESFSFTHNTSIFYELHAMKIK
ncbi:ubiquinone biosynthesis O-methyltransferase-like isoform X2 [Onthophagus taurus]|uniref:ubiquinone biosynthesis O-methyltransferase-like isoform X2 n=1 Tax=Onthophagus taurus TaxID=166361 RepID=UPI0039BE9290